jgi:hypothetical protein
LENELYAVIRYLLIAVAIVIVWALTMWLLLEVITEQLVPGGG